MTTIKHEQCNSTGMVTSSFDGVVFIHSSDCEDVGMAQCAFEDIEQVTCESFIERCKHIQSELGGVINVGA